MAPGLTDVLPSASPTFQHRPLKDLFPDGIKTSGQQSPLYEDLRPYDEFPEEITGPTLWKAEDYKNNPERWTHYFTEKEIAEMSDAAEKFRAAGIPLTGISKVSYTNRVQFQYTQKHVGEFLASEPVAILDIYAFRTS